MNSNNVPSYIKILFLLNSIALIGLVVLAFNVANRDYRQQTVTVKNQTDANAETDYLPETKIDGNSQATENGGIKTEESAFETGSKIFGIEITDDGFVNKGFQSTGNDSIVFSIKNSGAKPHSLVIKELNVDSGEIKAGEEKEIAINNLPDESKSYSFYSATAGDSKDNFSGILMVLKK
jgi:hypothetical protein